MRKQGRVIENQSTRCIVILKEIIENNIPRFPTSDPPAQITFFHFILSIPRYNERGENYFEHKIAL